MTHSVMVGMGGRADPNAPRPPLRDRIAALRLVPRLLRLVWETQPTYTAAMIALRLARSAVPVTNLWIAKLIIDEVVMLARAAGSWSPRHLWTLVALEMATVVGGELLARASSLIEGLLGDLFTNRISIRIMEHAATLDLHQFEDPKFYDHLEIIRLIFVTNPIEAVRQYPMSLSAVGYRSLEAYFAAVENLPAFRVVVADISWQCEITAWTSRVNKT